jgi:putative ABC transport system permease protein
MLYVDHELHYDRYNENFDDIYRIAVDARIGNTVIRNLGTPAPMPAAMYTEFPEIKAISRIYDQNLSVILNERVFNESLTAAVDSSFCDIFTLNFVEGSSEHALNEPGQVIIDRTTARKYFDDKPAVGQVILVEDTIPLTITGVFEDFPVQSHFHFNILVSLLTYEGMYNNDQWFYNDYTTYLALQKAFPYEELQAKLPDFVDTYMYGGKYEESSNAENYWVLYLQQLREIHLGSDLNGEFEANSNKTYIRVFFIVAIMILGVACINFMNLITAGSSIRAREVGIRKTNGASRGKLRQQFLFEAIISSILSMILALILVESLMGTYHHVTGKEIELHYLGNFLVVPGLLSLAIIVGLISGSYPAFHLSGFSATEALGFKGIRQSTSWFRNFLVMAQFSVAICLITATILVQKQMRLVLEERLGFDKEQTILVNNANCLEENLHPFMDELLNLPEVIQTASSFKVPGDKLNNWGFGAKGVDGSFTLNVNLVDESYLETMGMEMAEGRFFSKEFGAETDKMVLNETAVKILEFEDPIGQNVHWWGDEGNPLEVIGIIKDYHWESKQQLIRPHALLHLKSMDWVVPSYISVKVDGTDMEKMIRILKEGWETHVDNVPFEYEFLDSHYEAIYSNEKQTRALLGIFAAIAIFISCLGLFGLASFMADRRRKEIGIRKTNGASTGSILGLLSFDFTKWVLLSNIIAWPIAWFALRKWIEGFAYRVDIQLWIFLAGGFLAFFVALAAVILHAIRASRQNPVMSLRYE